MMIRRAAIQDLEQIMQIYARAVQYICLLYTSDAADEL